MAERTYPPGFEPSAPPPPPGFDYSSSPYHQSSRTSNSESKFTRRSPRAETGEFAQIPDPLGPYSHEYRSPKGKVHKYETVQDRLLNVASIAVSSLWRNSHTVARIDLVRATDKAAVEEEEEVEGGGQPNGRYGRQDTQFIWARQPSDIRTRRQQRHRKMGFVEGIRGIRGDGARLKIMQLWEFPGKETGLPSPPGGINFGFGANFEVDRGRLEPKLRIRGRHVALHMFPRPALELRGKWPLGNSNVAVDVKYRVPLHSADRFWERDGGARFTFRLFNPLGSGFHLSPGGLSFDEKVVHVGKHTSIRVAATVMFPKQLPLDEDEEPLKIKVERLGIKTRLT